MALRSAVYSNRCKKNGVISPGAVGFDINCGVRLMKTNLAKDDVRDKVKGLLISPFIQYQLVGSKGSIKLDAKDERDILVEGARWAVKKGFGEKDDLEHTEANGAIEGA